MLHDIVCIWGARKVRTTKQTKHETPHMFCDLTLIKKFEVMTHEKYRMKNTIFFLKKCESLNHRKQ